MGVTTFPQTPMDNSLSQYFSWVGAQFPFNNGAADITISGSTTWTDAIGYKQVGKLTINAGQTLSIQKSPFYIFANEISFGDTASTIDASGPSGAVGLPAFPVGMANGGTSNPTNAPAVSQGGCGGGMLFIICNKLSGANGVVKANGGNGYSNATPTSGSYAYPSGQGAIGSPVVLYTPLLTKEDFHLLIGTSNYYAVYTSEPGIRATSQKLFGAGGGTSGGTGGGSGGNSSGGGSGIGGGGTPYPNGLSGAQATVTPTILDLLTLANLRCLGGGGGGCVSSASTNSNGGGGGGGGSIVIWTHTAAATPTLQANGGTGSYGSVVNSNGGAGVTYFIIL